MTFTEFLEAEIKVALKEAEKHGYDEPMVKPEQDELELYLQDILGFISFNKTVAKFYNSK
jgi:hypothetical protein